MASRFAIASGNWSNPSIWDDGIGPVAGDFVFANNYTVTIDQNLNVGYLATTPSPITLPNVATPAMTSNNTPSGVAAASSVSGTLAAYLAFDQNYNTQWIATSSSGWLSYQFPTSKIIKRYLIRGSSTQGFNPRIWTFEGSNDGTNWTILDSVSLGAGIPINTSYTSSALTNTTSYIYYRLNISLNGNGGNRIDVMELEMTELTGTTYGQNPGGTFLMTSPYNIVCTNSTGIISQGTNTGCLTISASTGTINITSNVFGGSSTGGYGINILNSGTTINITGDIRAAAGGSSAHAIFRQSNSTLTLNGTINNSGSNANAHGITNTAAGTINLNGNINCNGGSGQGINNQANSLTLNIVGNIFGSFSTNSTSMVSNTGNAVINITGNIIGSTVNSSNHGVNSSGVGTINVLGNVNGGSGGSGNNGLNIGGGNLNVTGNVIGGTTSSSFGISFAALTANVIGTVSGGTNVGGVNNNGSNFNITGNCFASSTYSAVDSPTTTGVLTISGSAYNNGNVNAIVARRLRFQTDNNMVYRLSNQNDSNYTFYPVGSTSLGTPSTNDVRFGTTYGNGALTGTLIVPNPATVLSGVPTDNTVGTYSITPEIISQTMWSQPMSGFTDPNSIGFRLKNSSTVDSTAATIAAYNV